MRLGYLTGNSVDVIYAWARRLVDDLNRSPSISDLPVFANDAAAAGGRVGINEGYVTPDGFVRRRMA